MVVHGGSMATRDEVFRVVDHLYGKGKRVHLRNVIPELHCGGLKPCGGPAPAGLKGGAGASAGP